MHGDGSQNRVDSPPMLASEKSGKSKKGGYHEFAEIYKGSAEVCCCQPDNDDSAS